MPLYSICVSNISISDLEWSTQPYLTLQSCLDAPDHGEDLRSSGLTGLLSEPPALPGLGLGPRDGQEDREEEQQPRHQHHHPAGGERRSQLRSQLSLAVTTELPPPALQGGQNVRDHNGTAEHRALLYINGDR